MREPLSRVAAGSAGSAGGRGTTGAGVAVLITLLLGSVAVLFAGCGKSEGGGEKAAASKEAKFHCPMHPTYVSDRQGDCPICGMRLVPIKKGAAATAEAGHEGHEAAAPEVPGRVTVMVDAQKRQLIGLTTSTVEERTLTNLLRTTATVVHDETRLARISPRFAGWVRKLNVNYTGQEVQKGQPLFTVYSPELFTAETEYLLAWRNFQLLTNSPAAEQHTAKTLLESSRRRLELLQIGEEEIRELEKTGRASDELQIRSPVSGHVVTKTAVEGKSFMAGETLYEIADLERLWLRTAVFEYQLAQIRVGQKARVVFPYLSNKAVESEVTFISPHIDPQTRRGEVRLEIQNEGHVIRPDMWANVEIESGLDPALVVPAMAVIDTGARQLVFVDRPDQHLEPREIKVGFRTDEYWQVLEGVKAGEKVVSRALFMVDSESQLKAAIAAMQH